LNREILSESSATLPLSD